MTLLSQCYIIISQFFQTTSVTIHRDVNILPNHPTLSEKWPDSIHLCAGSTRHRKHLRAHGTTPSFMGLETDAHQMTQEQREVFQQVENSGFTSLPIPA